MSDQPNSAPAEDAPAPPTQQTDATKTNDAVPNVEKAATGVSQPAGEKKLTGAELKAQAKAEKAARRAQQKNSKEVAKAEAAVSSSPQQLGPTASEVKGKQKGKDGAAGGSGARPILPKAPASTTATEQKVQVPECFSHLTMAKRLPITQADKDVHPAVLALGQQMAAFAIDESVTRLRATLLAFQRVGQFILRVEDSTNL